MKALTFIAWALLALGCSGEGPTPVHPERHECELAQVRIEALDCRRDDGSPRWLTPAGTPFAEVCVHAEGGIVDLHPECLARARACTELDARSRGEQCD